MSYLSQYTPNIAISICTLYCNPYKIEVTLYSFYLYKVFEIWYVFSPYSTSQFELATLQDFNYHTGCVRAC